VLIHSVVYERQSVHTNLYYLKRCKNFKSDGVEVLVLVGNVPLNVTVQT